MKKLGSMLMLLVLCLVGCTNTDDLQDDVDALKKRVLALETQIRDINSNIEAIRELVNEGIFITDINEKSDSYTLTLSNGKTLNLYMKNNKNLLCPLIGIDADGYWTVCYNLEDGYKPLLVNGQKVSAKGESGKTPEFTVDADGYWKVRYSKDEAYQFVYREGTTEKVSATGGGSAPADSFFEAVTVEGNELVLTMKGEGDSKQTIRIPIVSDFECSFAADDQKDVHVFGEGETKEFTMTLKGVENTMITAPDGWVVKFSKEAGKENVLVVTSPASAAKTRATADNGTDIAILATHGKYAMIAKIQVAVVARVNYKADFENGTLKIGDETLDPTKYTAKVINGSEESDLSAEFAATDATVIFLNGTTEFTINVNKTITAPIVVVGQYPDQRPTIVFGETAYLALKSGKLLFKNANIKARAANYLFNSPASGEALFTNLTIEDCKLTNITKAMYYVSATTVGIGNITFKNSLFEFTNTGNIAFFNTTNTVNPSVFGQLNIENNIIYHKTKADLIQLFNWNTGTATTDTKVVNINIKNNSFINVKGGNVFIKGNVVDLKYTNNIFCTTIANTLSSYLYDIKSANSTVSTTDNIVYDNSEKNWAYTNTEILKPANNTMEKIETVPFTSIDCVNGVFVKDPAYENYGATIK